MRLTGYQPQYFPRLHYIARVLDADIFTISDHVQFVKSHAYPTADGGHKRGKSYQADTLIKSAQGVQCLTVPIVHEGKLLAINEIKPSYTQLWSKQHLKSFKVNYVKAANTSVLLPQLTELLTPQYEHMAQLNIATILWALTWILTGGTVKVADLTLPRLNQLLQGDHPFRLRKVVVKSLEGILPPGGDRDANTWIIETCQRFGADEFYGGGTAAAAYMDVVRFEQAGIRLVQQDWVCQPYTQQHPKQGFIPNLSIIDLLANEPQERIWQILLG